MRQTTNLVENNKKLFAGQSCQAFLHVAAEFVSFLEASIRSRDNRDFDVARRTTSEDNLGCESST